MTTLVEELPQEVREREICKAVGWRSSPSMARWTWPIPPLILATAAAAMDMEAAIFFTFYGLEILKKGNADKLKVAPIANPAMPMPVPNIIGMLPGMTAMATVDDEQLDEEGQRREAQRTAGDGAWSRASS